MWAKHEWILPQSWHEFGQRKLLDGCGYGVTQRTAMLTNCEVLTNFWFDTRRRA
jgi:hypothetical protein